MPRIAGFTIDGIKGSVHGVGKQSGQIEYVLFWDTYSAAGVTDNRRFASEIRKHFVQNAAFTWDGNREPNIVVTDKINKADGWIENTTTHEDKAEAEKTAKNLKSHKTVSDTRIKENEDGSFVVEYMSKAGEVVFSVTGYDQFNIDFPDGSNWSINPRGGERSYNDLKDFDRVSRRWKNSQWYDSVNDNFITWEQLRREYFLSTADDPLGRDPQAEQKLKSGTLYD